MQGRAIAVWAERRGRYGRRRMESAPARLVDLSVSGARIEVGPADVALRRGHPVELDFGGERCPALVIEVVPSGPNAPTSLRVEFVAASPSFLSRVSEWLPDRSGGRPPTAP